MVQSNSIASAVTTAFAIPEWVTGFLVALAAILIFAGGMKRIASFAEFVVPIMALVYIVSSLVILFLFRDNVVPALKMIFVGAFSPQAAIGGIAGASVRAAVQKGVARGLFSNEAGMGSTPHAHAVAHVDHPVQQGLAAMVGVFIDTVVVCSATALIILVTESYMDPALKGAQVTQAAFSIAFGGSGSVLLAICLTFFAFTTIIGWYYFGESNIKYLFGTKGVLPYQILVAIFIFLGALQEVDIVWMLADTFNALMVIPNLFGLFFLSNQVKAVLEDYDRCKLEGRIFYDYDVK
jgi:AGCS family alanine or glycine:cation symporter